MEAFIGQLGLFGFNFAPQGWLPCNGQLLSISVYDVLYQVIGTTYGGDGIQTFALPNLQSRVPVGFGQGADGYYAPGQTGGAETVTLSLSELASHSHAVQCIPGQATSATAANNLPGSGLKMYGPGPANAQLSGSVSIAPSSPPVPHDNLQPYLALNWCICTQGVFPAHG